MLTTKTVWRGLRLRCELRGSNECRIGNPDVGHEAVTATPHRFDEAGTLGGVPERITDLVDRLVEPMAKIHEGICGPQPLLKVFAPDDLAGVLEQHRQDLEGLLLKPDLQAALAQFASTKVNLEHSKTEPPGIPIVWFHVTCPALPDHCLLEKHTREARVGLAAGPPSSGLLLGSSSLGGRHSSYPHDRSEEFRQLAAEVRR